MATAFAHLDHLGEVAPSSSGREEGVRTRLRWVHPRRSGTVAGTSITSGMDALTTMMGHSPTSVPASRRRR
jgi:hypothetical protein